MSKTVTMDTKDDENLETPNKVVATSTPSIEASKRGTKRVKTRHPGSESSLDGDLSYLDLDTGKILAASKDDNITITKCEFDNLVTKLDSLQSKFEAIDNLEKYMCKLQDKFEAVDKLEKCMTKLNKLDKLDAIEKFVGEINDKAEKLDQRLLKVEQNSAELQNSAEFLSAKYDSLVEESRKDSTYIKEHSAEIKALAAENAKLKVTLSDIHVLHKEIKADLVESKCREMRDNLLFMNVEEVIKTNKYGQRYEETEAVLNEFLWNRLGLNNISFERVHRIPTAYKPDRDKPRPIVAKFTYFKDREHVRRSGYMLKGTGYGINEQFPEEIEQKRRELYPVARHFRGQKKRVILVRDRLFVDGEEVRAEDVEVPQESRHPRGPPTARSSAWNVQEHPRRDPQRHHPGEGSQSDGHDRQTGAFQPAGYTRDWSRGRSRGGRLTARGSRQSGAYRGTGARGGWSRGGYQPAGSDRIYGFIGQP